MNKLVVVALSTLFAANVALAQPCEEKAIDKNGKPLHGAAKDASIKKCMKDNPAAPAATEGKTAQQDKMKKCNADATGKKGDERKQFMSACLKN